MKYQKIAEIFIKEPSSLEMLLMLADEGSKTVEQISEIIDDKATVNLLEELRQVDLIYIKDNLINITSLGQNIITKLRKKNEQLEFNGDKNEQLESNGDKNEQLEFNGDKNE